MDIKELVVKQEKQPFGFGKPEIVETTALELASGKTIHIDKKDNVFVYSKRSELEEELSKSGKTEIAEKAVN